MSDAGLQVFAMNLEHHIGPCLDQVFVAALERRTAEIGGGEMPLLQHGAHGPVEHEDARGESVVEVLQPLFGITHNQAVDPYILAGVAKSPGIG